MIFRSLSIYNVGVYKDHHQFDLRPLSRERPISVVRGHNGSGKSTLFQTIALALFGPLALGDRVSQKEYSDFLLQRLHRRSVGGTPTLSDEAGVTLHLDYVQSGKAMPIQITRHWHRRGEVVDETLEVFENRKPIDAHPEDYQAWLYDLIPPGLQPICFFDSERLDSLASPETHDALLGDTLQRLLGLDLVNRLDTDLAYFITKSSNSQKAQRIREQRDHILQLLKSVERERDTLQGRIDRLDAERQATLSSLDEKERELQAEGGKYAERRPFYKQRLEDIRPQIAEVSEQIRDLSSGLLPFTLSPRLCRLLAERLAVEARLQRQRGARDLWHDRLEQVGQALQNGQVWEDVDVSEAVKQKIRERILTVLQLEEEEDKEAVLIHRLADEERERIVGWITQALEAIPNQVEAAGKRLRELRKEQKKIEKELDRAPDDALLAPLHQEIQQLQKQVTEQEAVLKRLHENLGSLKFQLEEQERELSRKEEALRAFAEGKEDAALASKSQEVLRRYKLELLNRRIGALEDALVRSFNEICRKHRFLSSVTIDQNDYSIELHGTDGHTLGIKSLSAGERELYALALLKALREVSGRQLPLLVDTPVARLDTVHRPGILRKYFPSVSNQVLLVGTDVELDDEMLDVLKPHLVRVYDLEYDMEEAQTKVQLSHVAQEAQPSTGFSIDEDIFEGA